MMNIISWISNIISTGENIEKPNGEIVYEAVSILQLQSCIV